MSRENLDLIRRANAAFNAGDWDGWLALLDRDFAYYEGGSYLDTPSVVRGRDQMRSAIESFVADLDGFRADIVELIDAGDRVLCMTRWRGTGRSSGLPVELLEAIVYSVRNGLLSEGRVFPDRAEALEALELSEQDAHAGS
jgi:ketosteroid isomerase-like protein